MLDLYRLQFHFHSHAYSLLKHTQQASRKEHYTMFQRILVPLDGSTRAEQALPVAARLAHASSGTIVFLRVVYLPNQFVSYLDLEPMATQAVIDTQLEEAKNYLDHLARSNDLSNVHTETEVMVGQPAVNILSAVDTRNIDLVVLCSHGYTGMTRWVLGSVAEKVAHHSPVPVLLLREAKPLLAGLHLNGVSTLRALIPLDGSVLALSAIAPAAQLVTAVSAPGAGALHLTQVVVMPGRGEISHTERETILQQAKQNLSATVEEMRAGLIAAPGIDHRLSVTWSVTIGDDIAAGIARMAENGEDVEGVGVFEGCDIIAMATHGYSGLQRWAVGSITERVLHATRLPLLIVRPPDGVAREH
jgi:nucleotide-binding universal stress UspA family protein